MPKLTIPKFLLQKKFMMESVFFVFAFSVLYLFIYKPFSATLWFGFDSWRIALLTVGYFVVAISVMIASKFVVLAIQKRFEMRVWAYLLVTLVEFLMLSAFYLLFTSFRVTMVSFDVLVLLKTSLCVLLILSIPYSIFILYTGYRSQRDEVKMLRNLLSKVQSSPTVRMISLYDTFGTMKISIDQDSIYYIESQDNYVKIYYELEGRLTSYMLRCRTQQMEEMLSGTSIHRCHRSYFVNFDKVTVLNHGKGKATVTLSHPDVKQIPVSKTYYRTVLSANIDREPRTERA